MLSENDIPKSQINSVGVSVCIELYVQTTITGKHFIKRINKQASLSFKI